MKILRSLLTITLLLSLTLTGYAQGRKEMPKRIKAMKVAFFTEDLDLSSEEAEKFWPVYNDYESRKEKLYREHRTSMHHYRTNKENISDDEARKMLSEMIAFRKKETQLMEEFQAEFLEILPPQKVMAVFIAEFEFKTYLLKQLREHHGKRRNGPLP